MTIGFDKTFIGLWHHKCKMVEMVIYCYTFNNAWCTSTIISTAVVVCIRHKKDNVSDKKSRKDASFIKNLKKLFKKIDSTRYRETREISLEICAEDKIMFKHITNKNMHWFSAVCYIHNP